MREIKFRVWNGECMVSPDYICREGTAHWKENSIPQSSNKLMQYTGLKDRDGKDIYEGDILSCYGGTMNFLIYVDTQHGYRFLCGRDLLTKALATYGKIVGNIYENPELLEAQNE